MGFKILKEHNLGPQHALGRLSEAPPPIPLGTPQYSSQYYSPGLVPNSPPRGPAAPAAPRPPGHPALATSFRLRTIRAPGPEPRTLSMRCLYPLWPIRCQSRLLKTHLPPPERARHKMRGFYFPALANTPVPENKKTSLLGLCSAVKRNVEGSDDTFPGATQWPVHAGETPGH